MGIMKLILDQEISINIIRYWARNKKMCQIFKQRTQELELHEAHVPRTNINVKWLTILMHM